MDLLADEVWARCTSWAGWDLREYQVRENVSQVNEELRFGSSWAYRVNGKSIQQGNKGTCQHLHPRELP